MDPPVPVDPRLSGNGTTNVNTGMTPGLSIITPAYNSAAFIEACLRNVIEQDCPGLEHIVVDGGSQDGTVAILESMASAHPHIRFVSAPDRGQADAMNAGLRMARAPVVGFLNVDDYYEPRILAAIIRRFAALPAPSLLVGNCNLWDERGARFAVNRPYRLDLEALLMGPEQVEYPVNPSAYFYHRAIHDLVGGYDVDDHYAMDLDFLLRAVGVAHVTYVDETWGNFRLLADSKTQQQMLAGRNLATVEAVLRRHIARLPLRARWRVRWRRARTVGVHRNRLRARNLLRKMLRVFGR